MKPAADEQRRTEALRRFDVVHSPAEQALDEAVRLVQDLVGAHAVALTLVTSEHAWTKAGTLGQLEVARDASFAARVVGSPETCVVVTVTDGHELSTHPAVAGLQLPVTGTAVPVAAPGGEVIGALEIVWADQRELGPELRALLLRFAAHAGNMLELRAEASEYRRFIELSPDPVIVLDVDGAIVLANPALVDLLGYGRPEELIGRLFLELVDRPDRTRATSELARVLFARSRTAQLDLRLQRIGGESVSCSVSAGHLRGARRHLQLVVHDLSDRLRGEDQRSRLSEQLARAQRLDAVGQIAGGLAHDLNNLLVVMVSNLSLAEESLTDTEAQVGPAAVDAVRQDLQELRVAVDRAGALTSKLLEFAQRADGEDDVAEVAAAVKTVQGLTSRSLGAGVSLVVEVAPDLPPVAADPVKLERALVNLVINARDAMIDGGTVRIVARRPLVGSASEKRHADVQDGGAGVIVEVVDDGRGMEASVRARAFEPLYTTKGEGGSGLGLATVAAFVDEIDGSIRLASVPGEGTRVSLSLPLAEGATEPIPVGGDVPIGGARVLLVDPGERTRRVIVRMLQGAGYRVRAVASAEEALEALAETHAELLVTELSLPVMTGARLLAEVRARYPDICSVALATTEAPRTLDTTPVLVKPFSHTRLLRAVERVMQGR